MSSGKNHEITNCDLKLKFYDENSNIKRSKEIRQNSFILDFKGSGIWIFTFEVEFFRANGNQKGYY